jgi:hypothetical protein
MILALSKNCPIFRPESKAHLFDLLYTLEHRRRHLLASPDPAVLHQLLSDDAWSMYGTFLTQAAKQAINSSQKWVAISDCSACDAQKLARFCALPTAVIVENAQTDGGWLAMMIRRLRPRLAGVLAQQSLALDIRTAGGVGEIPKEVARIGALYQSLRPHERMPLRVVALADSDSRQPGEISAGAHEVKRAAESVGAVAHILRKRTIENYIPDDSLYRYAAIRRDRSSAVELVASLQSPARDHYPLKTGLTSEELAATGNMYPSGIDLGVNLGDFITDFMTSFGHDVDQNELRKRDGENELDDLLDLLEENL